MGTHGDTARFFLTVRTDRQPGLPGSTDKLFYQRPNSMDSAAITMMQCEKQKF